MIGLGRRDTDVLTRRNKRATVRAEPAAARRACASAGFTLFEILLALGLSIVLLVAVGAAIDLYRRMTLAGQSDINEARLVRAVLRKIESDVRAAVPPQASQSQSSSGAASGSGQSGSSSSGTGGSTGGNSAAASSGSSSQNGSSSSGSNSSGGTTGSDSSNAASVEADPLQTVYSRQLFGLYGTSQALVVNVPLPHRLAPQVLGMAAQPLMTSPQSDMKTVAYFLVGEGGLNSQVAPGLGTGGTSNATSPPTPSGQAGAAPASGLARLEGDRALISYAMEQTTALNSSAKIVAPEIVSLTFRYFDGAQWNTTWDSAAMQRLPLAVEIVVGVVVDDDRQRTASQLALPLVHTYRHVVPIAAAPITNLATETLP